jgi:MYXO-CTERM domain-containing protein
VDSFSGNQVGFRISSFNPSMNAFYDRIMVATAVMPEPHAAGLVLMALAMAALARRQRR